LNFPHWEQHKVELSNSIRELIEVICLHYDELFDFANLEWPTETQIIEIEHLPQWVDILNSHLTAQYKSGEKFRLLHDESLQKMLAVILSPNGKVKVREFNRKFTIQNGALAPLRQDLQVSYNSRLELEPNCLQKLEVGPHMTMTFDLDENSNNGSVHGSVSRGYLLQKHQVLAGEPVESYGRLLLTLKRYEQHFVRRESDPFYQGLIQAVEHGLQLLRLMDPTAIQHAPELLARAQNALENVYIGDKLLTLLTRDLQNSMVGKPVQRSSVLPRSASVTTQLSRPNNQQVVQKPAPKPQAMDIDWQMDLEQIL
jgi:hypothetical protein